MFSVKQFLYKVYMHTRKVLHKKTSHKKTHTKQSKRKRIKKHTRKSSRKPIRKSHKSTRNPIKQKRKNPIRKRTKKHKKRHHKGGRKLGEGAYGIVYGDPALPCMGETEAASPAIVSKYFKPPRSDDEFAKESEALEKLKPLYDELRNYAILPTGSCVVDCDKIGTAPYDETYGFNPAQCIPEETKVMKYPKGGESYATFLRNKDNLDTFDKFIHAIKMVENIGKGIQLLQNNGLIHSDIKSLNMVVSGDTLKLIDMADVQKIESVSNIDLFTVPTAFMYYVYPPIAPWLGYYNGVLGSDRSNPVPSDKPYNVSQEKLIQLYNHQIEFNRQSINNKFGRLFDNVVKMRRNIFNIDDDAFTLYEEYTKHLLRVLYAQKLLRTAYKVRTSNKQLNKLIVKNNTPRLFEQQLLKRDNPELEAGLAFFNGVIGYNHSIFGGDESKVKENLYKRVDVYAFGILILETLRYFTIYAKDNTINKSKLPFMKELYEIAFTCCYQDIETPDINVLMDQLSKSIENMEDILLATATPPSATPPSATLARPATVQSSTSVTSEPVAQQVTSPLVTPPSITRSSGAAASGSGGDIE